jgi:hypothetical protein
VVILIPECTLTDVNGVLHHQVSYPIGQQTSGKEMYKNVTCKMCKSNGKRRLVHYYCHTCGLSALYCADKERDCFCIYVLMITRSM